MKVRVKPDSQINHLFRTRHTASLAPEPCKPVPLRKVVAFNQMCLRFCLNQQFRRDQIAVCAPFVREEDSYIPALQSLVKFCKCSIVSPSTFPVDKLTGIAAISLPYPKFVFLSLIKCHISSSSTTTASDFGFGFS